MKKQLVIILMIVMGLSAYAMEGAGLNIQLGTYGGGVEFVKSLKPNLNARVGGSFFTFGQSYTNDDTEIDYEFDLKQMSVSLMLDYYLAGNFYASLGAVINPMKADLSGIRNSDLVVTDNLTLTPEEIGPFSGTIKFNTISPYLGIGIGNAARGGVGFVLNLGVLYTGSPQVDLEAGGMIEPTAEQDEIMEENIKALQFLPVLTLGMTIGL